jgi:hypothetical protein
MGEWKRAPLVRVLGTNQTRESCLTATSLPRVKRPPTTIHFSDGCFSFRADVKMATQRKILLMTIIKHAIGQLSVQNILTQQSVPKIARRENMFTEPSLHSLLRNENRPRSFEYNVPHASHCKCRIHQGSTYSLLRTA